MDHLIKHIEALIFCAETPITTQEIGLCLSEMFGAEIDQEEILASIGNIQERYSSDDFSIEVVRTGGGYQFMTKPAYQQSIGILLKHKSKKRLSGASLETMSIIAYKQPVSKPQLEQIRGVNCDYAIKKLLDAGLVEIKGKSDAVGKPIMYGTSAKFLEYFGINSIGELPTLKDIKTEEDDDNIMGNNN